MVEDRRRRAGETVEIDGLCAIELALRKPLADSLATEESEFKRRLRR